MAPRDSSSNRTYLTRHNHHGESLHPKLAATIAQSQQPESAVIVSCPNATTMVNLTEEEIHALPVSSDDEDVRAKVTTAVIDSSTKSSPKRKRPLTEPTRKSKRSQVLEDRADIGDTSKVQQPLPPVSESSEPHWLTSQRSQSQRTKQKTYGRKFRPPDPEPQSSHPGDPAPVFFALDDIAGPTKAPTLSPSDFLKFDSESPMKQQQATNDQSLVLKIPDLPRVPESTSSTTTGFEHPSIFDGTTLDEDRLGDTLRSPTSSHTSVDAADVVEIQIGANTSSVECPVCRQKVERSSLNAQYAKVSTLAIRKQQGFCHQHRLAEAQVAWRERNYPDIKWFELENTRIPKQIPHLKKVLQRKVNSLYLQRLDEHVTAFIRNRNAIKLYLQEGVFDVAKPGYYGPKGTTIMVNSISHLLATDFRLYQGDAAIKAAGVGNYTAAVLVPELTMRLVMDDMNTRSQDTARQIMDESNDIGALVNVDDDHVELDDCVDLT